MDKLPTEVIKKILSSITKYDFRNCYIVNKSWHSALNRFYWEEITLHGSQNELVKSHFKETDYKKYFKQGHLIKKLTLTGIQESNNNFDMGYWWSDNSDDSNDNIIPREIKGTFSKDDFLLLLDQLPNLVEIDIRECECFERYMQYLSDAKLQHIKKLPDYFRVRDFDSYDMYFSVCYKFRATLTTLRVHYQGTNDLLPQSMDVVTSLSQFNCLTRLNFHNEDDRYLTPLHILESCPKLEYLEFYSDYPLTEAVMESFMNSNNTVDLNFNSNLRHFAIRLPSLSKAYTRYLIEYLPNHLKSLSIEISKQTFVNWIDNVGMDNATKLMKKFSKINDIKISFKSKVAYARDSDVSRITCLFKLLGAFKETRKNDCELSLIEPKYKEALFTLACNPKGNISITYIFHEEDVDLMKFENMTLPDKTISGIGFEAIDILHFFCASNTLDITRNILKHVSENCTNLKEFDYMFRSRYSDKMKCVVKFQYDKKLNSLALIAESPSYCLSYLVSLRQKESSASSTSCLWDTENLSIKSNGWGAKQWDLTAFERLQTLKFITNSDETYGTKKYIYFKYANGDHSYYADSNRYKNHRDRLLKKIKKSSPVITFLCKKPIEFDLNLNNSELKLIQA